MERNSWVDYAKAIGIILVVYGHIARGVYNAGMPMNETLFHLVDSIIYSFHMPLFFFLSGLFFYDSLVKRGATGLILNKVDTVIYPFIIWSLLQGSFEAVLSNYTNGTVTFGEVFSFAWQPRAQFWFLYALFLVFMVCSAVYSWTRKSYALPLIITFSILYIFKQSLTLNFMTNFIFGNIVFFALGIWFNEIKAIFENNRTKLAIALGALFLIGQYIFHITLGLTYDVGGLPTLVLAVTSIFFVISLSMYLGEFRLGWISYIGASSMTIYLMHILAGSGTRVMLNKIMGISSSTAHLLIGTLVGIIAPLVAQAIIKRYNLTFLLTPPRSISLSNFRPQRLTINP